MEEFETYIRDALKAIGQRHGAQAESAAIPIYESFLDDDALTRAVFLTVDGSEWVEQNLMTIHTSHETARELSERVMQLYFGYLREGLLDDTGHDPIWSCPHLIPHPCLI